MKNVLTVLVVVALSAGAMYLYGRYDNHMTALSKASMDWPSTEGLITHSELDTRQRKVGTTRKMDHRVQISYEYVIGDKVFTNDTAQFNQNKLSVTEKQRLVRKYYKGRQVEVFYNPSKPKESVLVRGSYP